MKQKILEHLTEQEASKLISEDMARFEYFGYCGDKLLILNETGNTYHRSPNANHYERIGNMQIRR